MSRVQTRTGVAALAVLALVAGLGAATPSPAGAVPTLPTAAADAAVRLDGLRTNGRTDPLGIPGDDPSFGWKAASAARGVVQSAYQVRVASSEDALADPDVWDSGKVSSARQTDVLYGGPALTSQTRYVWQVRTWDGADAASDWSAPASFETGMLAAADWQDASWIGGAPGTELSRWTDYTAAFDFRLDNLAFGTFLRATDANNGYMWQVSVADGTPRLRPHKRVGGVWTLIANRDISAFVTREQLLSGWHELEVTFAGSTITTTLDGVVIDTRTDTSFDRGFVGLRSDQADQGTERAFIRDVVVTAAGGEVLLDTDFSTGDNPFTGGILESGQLRVEGRLEAIWRSPDSNLPLLRTDFETAPGKTVERARVYASAYGVYELQLNGEQVGDQILAPGWTDYRTRIQHQTYDVTEQVRAGENAFGAELGDGWWAGKVGMFSRGQYGTNVGVIALLRIDYADGTHQVVKTDPSWKSHYGPFVLADNIDGETYDENAEQPGWDRPGYDDAAWLPVVPAASATARLVPQPDDPVRVTGEVPAVRHTTPAPGVEIYDLGQNMVGVARMRLQGRAGQTVRIRYGEELNPDGSLYTANMRSGKVTDYYKFAETGASVYTPTFTQHGFRYLEITGASAAPALSEVTGVVWGSDLEATGDLATSDPMLNQLVSNISWGQRANFLSIPTDTPARDERLGWTGDINVFAPTASYLRDTRSFLGKWMVDLKDAGYGDGNFPGIAPVVPRVADFGSGLGWSDAAITVPYATWKAWDDGRIVRDNYEAMSDFLAFVQRSAGADLIDSGRGHWDDWLNLDDPTPTAVLGTAYYAENARMMSEMAAAIGEDDDAATYAELSAAVREAFTATLVQANGTVDGNSQAGYAMALGMGMITDAALRERVAARFVAKLAANDYHLSTGFLGTPWLLPALSSIGRDDLAYTMLTHTDYPSWGYEIENGATTMWERWNSIMPDGSFGPADMNSFNHYAYGAVGDWMYQNIGGISAVEPGYRVSRIAPVMGGGLTSGAGDFDSVYGPIRTDWTLADEDLSLQVEVPVNTTARVVLPAANEFAITEGGALLDEVDGVVDTQDDGETVTVTVGSGRYDFAVTSANALVGEIAVDLAELQAHVAAQETLSGSQREQLDTVVAAVRSDVGAALLGTLDGDAAAVGAALDSALERTRGLRAWLTTSGIEAPVRSGLDDRLAGIEGLLVNAVTVSLGVSVALPPVGGVAVPGSTLTGTVEVTNTGTEPVTGLTGTVSVAGLGEVSVAHASVPPGGSAQLPVELAVPRQADPGGYDADLALTLTRDGESFTITATTPAWASVTSGLAVGTITGATDVADPADHAIVTVPVTNAGTVDVRAHVALTLPAGWRSVPSSDVVVPAGGRVDVPVPVVVPLGRVSGAPAAVEATVRRAGATLATGGGTLALALPRPPAPAAVLDHVDFGDAASESAHGIRFSPSSGTTVEAGLTRRYSNSGTPGSWFSAEVEVPAGEPFVLRSVDTHHAPVTKRYDVYVDDVLVREHLLPRTEPGEGIAVYDQLVDDPAVLDNDGTVRVRYEYRLGTRIEEGFDPSIADLWVLPLAVDSRAPDVSAVVAAGRVGDEGWYRSEVSVAVAAADNRDAAPVVETAVGADWSPYAGPVAVAEDGRHELSYRARDAADNVASGTLPVWIDTVAPQTTLAVTRGAGVEGADSATLSFAATDATSGVASTLYRVDGGAWARVGDEPVVVTGFGVHVVEFASTDVAGNAEALRTETVTLADVDVVSAVVAPQVTGAARLGATLRASAGSWNTKGLSFARQWLRNGAPIAGATGSSYRVVAADIGRRISVRVTASKPGLAAGAAVSAATAPVAKVASRTRLGVNRARVRRGTPVRLTAVVASSPRATGRVVFRVGGKVVKRVALRNGRAVAAVRVRKPGRYRVTAVYRGSATVAASAAAGRIRVVR